MKAFATYHPASLFLYFIGALLLTVLTVHPVAGLSSLVGGVLFFGILNGPKTVIRNIVYYCFLFLLIAILFPAFSHNGTTPLFFLNDNPVTKEAIFYGIAISGMIVAVMFWCKDYSIIMTSDKFIYLFGRISPKASLYFSMFLRFIPSMKSQYRQIRGTQKTLGLYSSKSLTDKLFGQVRVFSILLTWSIENTIEKTSSMRARGYGLKGRRCYSIYTFRRRDKALFVFFVASIFILLLGMLAGLFNYWYYPEITPLPSGVLSVLLYALLILYALLPFIIELEENIRWNYLRSKI
ncbi:MAG: energy-coupling factor transporter transmembrane component T [Christensenellales bacterium]|jgi:energy-coupling factor transport system permease protein